MDVKGVGVNVIFIMGYDDAMKCLIAFPVHNIKKMSSSRCCSINTVSLIQQFPYCVVLHGLEWGYCLE